MSKITSVYYNEQPPETYSKAIFLAGPTPRSEHVKSWRPDMIAELDKAGYDGVVFVPESRSGGFDQTMTYEQIVEWEEDNLNRADCILFWIPRDMKDMPGLTTNDEFGKWKESGKAVLGTPEGSQKVRYQEYYANKLRVPFAHTMENTAYLAMQMVGDGVERSGGDRWIPAHVYKHKTFKAWLDSHKASGNSLEWARVRWNHITNRGFLFMWIVHVHVRIAAENRVKVNEFVIGRTDLASIVLFHTEDKFNFLKTTKVVLVREFRSPVRNSLSFVFDLAGGSSFNPDKNMKQVISSEIEEETGVTVPENQIYNIGTRQAAATIMAHQVTSYYAELTKDQLDQFIAEKGKVHGVEADSERTFVEVLPLEDILYYDDRVDWVTIGQIMSIMFSRLNSVG